MLQIVKWLFVRNDLLGQAQGAELSADTELLLRCAEGWYQSYQDLSKWLGTSAVVVLTASLTVMTTTSLEDEIDLLEPKHRTALMIGSGLFVIALVLTPFVLAFTHMWITAIYRSVAKKSIAKRPDPTLKLLRKEIGGYGFFFPVSVWGALSYCAGMALGICVSAGASFSFYFYFRLVVVMFGESSYAE